MTKGQRLNINETEMICIYCDGAGMLKGKICSGCGGHGVIVYDAYAGVKRYTMTDEQRIASMMVGFTLTRQD